MKTENKKELPPQSVDVQRKMDEEINDCAICVQDMICCRCGNELDYFDGDCDCLCHQLI